MKNSLFDLLGSTDIILVDHILRGYITQNMKVLDAGCGRGRNLHWFLQSPNPLVYGVDSDENALKVALKLAQTFHPKFPINNFQKSEISELNYPNGNFDLVICNAVLHFAKDNDHFKSMVHELWRVLKTGGILFIRTASMNGIENQIIPIDPNCKADAPGWYKLPDKSERFLLSHQHLHLFTKELNANLIDPVKTVIVDGKRSMSTWVLKK